MDGTNFSDQKLVLEYFMKNILNKKLLIEDLTVYKKWMINYIIYFKSIIKAKSSLLCKLMKHLVIVQNLKDSINEVEKLMTKVKMEISQLEARRNFETKGKEKKLVMSLKKMLSEVYTVNFNLLLIKEKQLRELEEHTHFNATNNALKDNNQLNELMYEHNSLIARNLCLKESFENIGLLL